MLQFWDMAGNGASQLQPQDVSKKNSNISQGCEATNIQSKSESSSAEEWPSALLRTECLTCSGNCWLSSSSSGLFFGACTTPAAGAAMPPKAKAKLCEVQHGNYIQHCIAHKQNLYPTRLQKAPLHCSCGEVITCSIVIKAHSSITCNPSLKEDQAGQHLHLQLHSKERGILQQTQVYTVVELLVTTVFNAMACEAVKDKLALLC